jgi:universal stress protein E
MPPAPQFILILSSVTHQTPAFERAGALAKAMGASLHLAAFGSIEGFDTGGLVPPDELALLRRDYLRQREVWLEQQACTLRALGVCVTTQALWTEHPLRDIPMYISHRPCDLIIKDVQPMSPLKRAIFTPLDLRLLHDTCKPIHFVATCLNALPRHIAAAVDLQVLDTPNLAANDRITSAAALLALQCQARMDLVYAYELSSIDALEYAVTTVATTNTAGQPQSLFQQQSEAFAALAERNRISDHYRHLIIGSAVGVIRQFAQTNDTDVVVIGRTHHRRIGHLLGTTTEQLLYKVSSLWMIPLS